MALSAICLRALWYHRTCCTRYQLICECNNKDDKLLAGAVVAVAIPFSIAALAFAPVTSIAATPTTIVTSIAAASAAAIPAIGPIAASFAASFATLLSNVHPDHDNYERTGKYHTGKAEIDQTPEMYQNSTGTLSLAGAK